MNTYETVFIITPILSKDQVKECTEKFRKILTQCGGQITLEESWGQQKDGFHHLFEYKSAPATVADLEMALKRDVRIVRFTTVRLDKHL